MVDQHEHIGKFVSKEQQAAKELAAAAEGRLKNLRLQTQKDCKARFPPPILHLKTKPSLIVELQVLEARLEELEKEGLAMEQVHRMKQNPKPLVISAQALMAAPPDFAMVREARAKALKLEHDVRAARSLAESKEALLLQLHSAMAIAPRYVSLKTESGSSARVVDVGNVVDKFLALDESALESEKLLQQRREAITTQEEEVDSLRWKIAEEEGRFLCAHAACSALLSEHSRTQNRSGGRKSARGAGAAARSAGGGRGSR
jgi:hypothetical protein